MPADTTSCICQNLTEDVCLFIEDPRRGVVYAFHKDCPDHGYRVLADEKTEQTQGDVEFSEKSSD